MAAREKETRERLLRSPDFWRSDFSELKSIHAQVRTEIGNYIDDWGWPGMGAFEWEGALAASQLVRFCFTEPVFMRKCLPYLEQAYRFGDAIGEWFAQYYDTLMYFENKPQVYGTYLDWDSEKKLSPWKIVDSRKVDQRRQDIQMEKLKTYVSKERKEASKKKLLPPSNIRKYRSELAEFANSVGWKRI